MIRINLQPGKKSDHTKWIFAAAAFLIVLLAGSTGHAHENIISGVDVKPGDFPGVVRIKMSDGSGGVGATGWEGSCTGFLVHPKLILTAAHCLQNHSQIDSITNAPDVNKGRGSRYFHAAEFNSFPTFVVPSKDRTDAENKISAATDIAYIVLKEEIPASEIAPFPIYLTTDNLSMQKLQNLPATIIGYGATQWVPNGDYTGANIGVKHIGRKPITDVNFGFITLAGEQGGALPGDSGGPVLAEIDGALKVVALNHGMTRGKETVPVTDRHGNVKLDKNGNPKTREVEVYGATLATMLTRSNLCWVEKASKIDIAGVDCQ